MTDFTRRMATITLPLRDNEGKQLSLAHQHLRTAVLDAFGGYSQSLITGAWKDDDGKVYLEDGLKYEIAMSTDAGDGKKLVSIATSACIQAKQICVMVQLASGVVHFIDQKGGMK
jgi:hypothetical protein